MSSCAFFSSSLELYSGLSIPPNKQSSPPPKNKQSSPLPPNKENVSYAKILAEDVDYENFSPTGSLSYNAVNAYIQLLKEQGKIYDEKKDLVLFPEDFNYIIDINKFTPPSEIAEIRRETDIKNEKLPEAERFKIAMNRDLIHNKKFDRYERIFMPAGYGTHWILIVFLPKRKKFFVLDAVRKNLLYDDVIDSMRRFLKYQKLKYWRGYIDNTFLPQQTDFLNLNIFNLYIVYNHFV